ncbi:MAG: COP23 domain-containing protein [Hormoscilla sp.]
MKIKYTSLIAGLAAGVLAVGCDPTPPTPPTVEFRCLKGYHQEKKEYVPTTFAWTQRGKSPVIRWVRDDFKAAGYDPRTRCEEVSPRFQEAYRNGSLKYLTNGEMHEQPVICSTREEGGDCETLLFTLLHKDDGKATLEDLEAVLDGRKSGGPMEQEGGGLKLDDETGQLYLKVDIDEFLRTAPVEPVEPVE